MGSGERFDGGLRRDGKSTKKRKEKRPQKDDVERKKRTQGIGSSSKGRTERSHINMEWGGEKQTLTKSQ